MFIPYVIAVPLAILKINPTAPCIAHRYLAYNTRWFPSLVIAKCTYTSDQYDISLPRQGTLSETQGILPNIAHDNFTITTTQIYDSEFIYACLPARKNRHQWHRTSSIYLLFMILSNANDVELNPGPSNNVESNPGPSIVNSSIKLCGRCKHPVTWNSKAICCDTCTTWFHINCHHINDSTYEELGSTSVRWHCFRCKQPNYSSIVFNSQSYIDNNNLSESHSRIEYTQQSLSITSDSRIMVGKPLHQSTRGRPWRYSVIPSPPDFQTGYQIRRNSNPAGIPVFAAIWGPDFI